MTSIKKNNTKYIARNVEFQYFWLKIGNRVGNANLPLINNAESLQEFIKDIDDQSNPLKQVIKTCYVQANCTTLNSSLNPFLAMNVLGECIYQLKHHHEPDVSLIDLIEHIGLYISQEFIPKSTSDPNNDPKLEATIHNTSSAETSRKQGNIKENKSNSKSASIVQLKQFHRD